MKKILIVLLLASIFAVIAPSANAQAFVRTRTATSTANVDTLINVDTIYHTLQTPGTNFVTIQLDVKKVTGTIGGKAYLYGCANQAAGNYVLLDSTSAYALGAWQQLSTDTYSYKWTFSPGQYLWYRIASYSSGTVRETPKAQALQKPYFKQ